MTKHVLVPIANASEDIELSCITDILKRADIKFTVASVTKDRHVKLSRGLSIVADALIEEVSANSFDAVFLPGGMPGAETLGKNEPLKRIMQEMRAQDKLYGAICAAPAVALGPMGLLEGIQTATCYPSMESKFPSTVKYVTDSVVKSGNCLTSRGPGTAIFFGLAAVALLRSKDVAKRIADDLLVGQCPEVNHILSL